MGRLEMTGTATTAQGSNGTGDVRDLRIVFTDVDGTLLGDDHHALPESSPAVRALMERNIPLVLVSARPPEGLRTIQRPLGFTGPLVCYSGAYAIDEAGNQLINHTLPVEDAVQLKRFFERELPHLCCMTYGFEHWLVDDADDPRVRAEAEAVLFEPEVGEVGQVFTDTGIHKFLLSGEPAEIEAADAHVRAVYPELAVARSSDILLEVMSGRASKAEGVRVMCEHFGIPVEHAAAFGDGRNDLDMLRAVPESFAMANAPAVVKEAAAHVTELTNQQNGVAVKLIELLERGL